MSGAPVSAALAPSSAPVSSAPFVHDGHELAVRFSLGALEDAQRALGVTSLADVFRAYDRLAEAFVGQGGDDPVYKWYEFDTGALGALLWAGTRAAREAAGLPATTPKALLDGLDFQELRPAVLAVTVAMSLAFRRYDQRPKAGGEGEAGAADQAAADPPAAAA